MSKLDSLVKAPLQAIWYALLLIEFIVWLATVSHLGVLGLVDLAAFIVIIPFLLMVEGLELAVTALLAQEIELSSKSAHHELKRLQDDRTLDFFPSRQAFVVISIVLLTMASNFDQLYIPSLGWTAAYGAPALFNLLFPTHTVLLLAQIPGKCLALFWPPRFFEQTWYICVAVRWIGKTAIAAPAKPIIWVLAKLFGYPLQPEGPARANVQLLWDDIDQRWIIMSW